MLHLMKLEDRIVLDGAAVGEAIDHALDHDAVQADAQADASFAPEDSHDATPFADAAAGAAALLADPEVQADPVDVVLISDNLSDVETLKDAVDPDAEVIVYDADGATAEDVMGRVAALSEGLGRPIESVTILSHGGEGTFHLGKDAISAETLADHSAAWETLDSVLAEGGRINLFGCNVSGGEDGGQNFLDALADATGAEVFASDDVTGHGGDWDLEAASGDGDSPAMTALDVDALDVYSHTLQNVSYTEDGDPVAIDPTVTITTTTSSYLESATVTLTGIEDGGAEQLDIDLLDTSINLEVVNQGDDTIVIELSGTEVVGNYERVLRTLTYENTSDDPTEGARNIQIETTELGGANGDAFSHLISVSAVNDAPTIIVRPNEQAYELGGEPTYISPNVFIDDPEENYSRLDISVTDADAYDTLQIIPKAGSGLELNGNDIVYNDVVIGNFIGDSSGATIAISFNATAVQTDAVRAIVDSVAYSNDSNVLPDSLLTNVEFTLEDSSGITDQDQVAISLTKPNVAPENLYNGDGNGFPTDPLVVNEDEMFVFSTANGNAISISDPDAPADADLQVTLTVTNGVLDAVDGTGADIDHDATNSVIITGTMGQINAALNGLTYRTKETDWSGADNLTIETSDLGNLGTDGIELTDTDIIDIDVQPINDPPSLSVRDPYVTNVNTPIVFDDVYGTQITIEDVDAGNASIEVNLGVVAGSLSLSEENVQLLDDVVGNGTNELTLTGSLEDINSALNGMVYRPPADEAVTDSLTVEVDDQGNTGLEPTVQPPTKQVIDIRVLEIASEPLQYFEGEGPLFINPDLEIDSFNIDGLESYMVSAQIQITNVQDIGSETLRVEYGDGLDEQSFDEMGIDVTYDSQTGILTLSGLATVDQYETVLQHIAYKNSEPEPNVTANRNVEYQLTGLNNVQSGVFYSTQIDVRPTNDVPVVPINNRFLTDPIEQIDFSEGTGSQLGDPEIVDEIQSIGDIDSDLSDGFLEISFVTYREGQWQNMNGEILAERALQRLNPDAAIGLDISDDQIEEISETPITWYDRIMIVEGNGITINGNEILYNDVSIGTVQITTEIDAVESGNNSIEEGGQIIRIEFNENIVQFRDSATGANEAVKQLISQIIYRNINDDNPVEGLHVLQFELNDGDTGNALYQETPESGYDLKIVQSQAINDRPINSYNGQEFDNGDAFLSAPIDVDPSDTFIFSQTQGNALSINDVDAYSYDPATGAIVERDVEVTLTANHGTLTLIGQNTDNVEVTSEGVGMVLTLKGTVDEINQALANSLAYTPESGYVGGDTITMTTNDLGNTGGDPLTTTNTLPINVLAGPGGPYRPPYEPPPFERPPLEPIWRPGIGEQEGIGIGPIIYPGEVQDTGDLQDVARALTAPCGDDVLYQCCTLEEALKIGCRFAPAIDPDARLCNITWDYMSNTLGFEDPFVPRIDGQYFNEELDLFNRLFMKEVESDPGFQVEPGVFADAFGMEEEAEFAKYNRDEEHDVYSQFSMQEAQGFNDMAPGELKEAFLKGMEGMDRPGRWDDDGDASEC